MAAIEVYGNNAASTLSAPINSSATSLTMTTGGGANYPSPGTNQFARMTLNDAATGLQYEVVYYTGKSGDTFTGLVRGQEGTTAKAWIAGDKTFEGVSAGAMSNLAQQVQVQTNLFNYVADTGAANAYVIALPISLATPFPGAVLYFLAARPNTGASTLTVNGGSTYPLLGQARLALQGGEVNQFCAVTFDATLSSYVLLYSSGGIPQVPSSVTKTQQAVSLGQIQAQFAALNGNSGQAFSTSQLKTTSLNANTAIMTVLSNIGLLVSNVAGTAFTPVTCAPSANANEAVTQGQFGFTSDNPSVSMWQCALPGNGLIIKFGLLVTTSTGVVAEVFTHPFPNNYLAGVTTYLTNGNAITPVFSGICTGTSKSQIVVNAQTTQNGGNPTPIVAANVFYILIGY